jgi:hypothetical protein
VSLVVKNQNRALNVIHGEILGCKKINIAIFGHGLVGERWLIKFGIGQNHREKKRHQAECFAIANSKSTTK